MHSRSTVPAQTHYALCAMATFSLHLNVKSTRLSTVWQIKVHLAYRFAQGSVDCSVGFSNAWRFALPILECVSLANLACAYGPHRSDQSWTFQICCRVHLLYPPANDTVYVRFLIVWKYFVYNIQSSTTTVRIIRYRTCTYPYIEITGM